MKRNLKYRDANFINYLKSHKSSVRSNFLNFGWIFIVGIIFMLFSLPFSYSTIFFLLFFAIWSIIVTNGSLLFNYLNFNKSSIIYSKIEPFIECKNMKVEIDSFYDEISIIKRLNHWGKYEISIGNFADVFETENSIFIFPFKNKKISNKVWPKIIDIEYNTPIRLTKNLKEKFTYNETGVKTFRTYTITKDCDNTLIKLKDKIFNTNIQLTLKNYENQIII